MFSLPWIHGCHGLKSRQFLVTIPSTKSRLFQEAWPQGNFNMEAVGFPFSQNNSETLCANLEPNIYLRLWISILHCHHVSLGQVSTRSSVSRIPTQHECPMMPHAVTSAPYPHGELPLDPSLLQPRSPRGPPRWRHRLIWWIVACTAFLYIKH